jgi:pimeloyl-ACP methyl ester carboxylesterase
MSAEPMRFVLIHGGFHGAWCWQRVIQHLTELGHEAVAIDLPGHGQRRRERSLLSDRRDAIIQVLRDRDVLVGHSGGGFDITLAADAQPHKIAHLIYLAAGLPIEGRPLIDATGGAANDGSEHQVSRLNETIPPSVLQLNDQGRMEWVDRDAAHQLFYHDCDGATVDWAFARFSPAPPEILTEPVSVPRFWSANLPRSYLLCLQDRALPFVTAMRFAARLGVMPQSIDSSHSPFLSQPAELARLLVRATGTRPVAPLLPS